MVSVRQVTQRNAGPQDRGDRRAGRAVLLGQGRDGGAGRTGRRLHLARPAGPAGVYTEGHDGQTAPARHSCDLGPRAIRRGSRNALEPEWEARFEPRSYGFRPGRGCQDAIEAIYYVERETHPAPVDPGRGLDRRRSTRSTIPAYCASWKVFPARDLIRAMAEGGRGRDRTGLPRPRREPLKAV